MARKTPVILVATIGLAVGGWIIAQHGQSNPLVLTGVVTTNDVVVSSQVGGRISQLAVAEGDSVARGQVVATLEPNEFAADRAFYARTAAALTAQVAASQDELETSVAQETEARATLANAKLTLDRTETLARSGGMSQQEVDAARTAYTVAQARAAAAERQVSMRRSALAASRDQQAAAGAQTARADTRLAYTKLTAPIGGVVDVRAAREGEVVAAGQPVVTLVNPDSLWVRADLEETYIDRVRLGDRLTIRLPSGEERQGTVFYRGVDADFATQRDVSRQKRDIKTFQIRAHIDNRDRRLAVGMTAYVIVPPSQVERP